MKLQSSVPGASSVAVMGFAGYTMEEQRLEGDREHVELAERRWRLCAQMIDSVLWVAASIPVFWALGLWSAGTSGWVEELVHNALFSLVGGAAFLAVNYRLLENKGQTIGKWCVGIAIVGTNGGNLGANHLLIARYLPVWVVTLIPVLGPWLALGDVLAIFGNDRRCVHDYLAGTKVVNINAGTGDS